MVPELLSRRTLLQAALAQTRRPPNILLLLADDMGSADLSSYGATDIRTPNIDSIGRDGIRFTRAYCNAPECTPSRTALLTGRYQQRVGGMECAMGVGNVGRYDEAIWLRERNQFGLPAAETSLARMLKSRGYDTACIGKWHLGYTPEFSPNVHGFDHYFGILGGNADYYKHTEEDGTPVLYENGKSVKREGYLTEMFGLAAVDWLGERKQNPWFLYVPFNAPHSPFQTPQKRDISPGSWNKGNRKTYAGMVEAMDKQVGAILDQLKVINAVDNTWVIFLSDNGGAQPAASNAPLRGFKSSVYEGGLRTPMLMRWPGTFRPGTSTGQVSLMFDVTAAILAAAGAKPNRPLDGENLLPIWTGRQPVKPRTVFWRYRRGENTRKAVLHGDWKLTNDSGKEELFHLKSDPKEENSQLTAQPAIATDLRTRLAKWEQDVRAPRLADFYRTRPAP